MTARTFPIRQIWPKPAKEVPWDFMEAHAALISARHGGQSLETLTKALNGSRLSSYQVLCAITGCTDYPCSPGQADELLDQVIAEWRQRQVPA